VSIKPGQLQVSIGSDGGAAAGHRPAIVHALSHPSSSSSSARSSARYIKAANAAVETNHTTTKIIHHFTK
jgi:hypothetical protein